MNWYYSSEGHARGPVSEQKLVDLTSMGTVSADTLIWHPGLEEWEPVKKLRPEIVGHLDHDAVARPAKLTAEPAMLVTQTRLKPVAPVGVQPVVVKSVSPVRVKPVAPRPIIAVTTDSEKPDEAAEGSRLLSRLLGMKKK